ncbi:TIGR03960 family B12-binding radical SAM protein [Desulfotalea psychrophila]|uniref:Radical SAM core domain-containing protein n=1 Tax=Desulfotalea psychrophila (strain LSv54 / DSM 12343) TaxID=177439 RepID=Q6AJD8_DESPS|nr:TIGR03960 family B12-binding radical SAM protein [Desulfotalea psychrophila]CAG37542.1 conserved hypothetical protein [Desulfotalea psychrophila LSv54]
MTDCSLFPFISKPGRYLGQEFNSTQKNWQDTSVRNALIFPDLYEIGMSHQGLQILYHILNASDNFLAERSYCPGRDVEKLLKEKNLPLTSLESGTPLKDFDIIGITLPYELCYTNILTILDLANIPFRAKDRDSSSPLLIAGGAGAFNPEPVAEIFDAIVVGDGEDVILLISELVQQSKKEDWPKETLLTKLAELDGIYVPSHFTPIYDDAGILTKIEATGPKETVLKCFVKDFEEISHLLKPIVPNAKIVHDRLGIEVARGCTRGCRFCQAGITYRPVRERSPEQIKKLAKEAIQDSGFDELALLSLSTGDYSCLDGLLPDLMNEFSEKFVSVAMPSMRVGTLSQNIMDQIKRVRKTGFTMAPEAGSERLRRVINKGITEEALLDTCKEAFTLGWTLMKLYFMIGLPTETDEDIEAIGELTNKVRQFRDAGGNSRKSQVNVSVGTFVPKPHTPFQWAAQLTIEESKRKIQILKEVLPKKGCKFKWHTPEQSFLEGVFSRGDRKSLNLLIKAWEMGARLDGWSEHFNLYLWREAAKAVEIDMDQYLRERDLSEVLPWQHIQTGVTTDFFKDELERAVAETYTPDCRYNKCQKCGVCDFKTVAPIVFNKKRFLEEPERRPVPEKRVVDNKDHHFKYIVHYSRKGNICFLGHLEILLVVFRALRRANIETNFSQGFNPSPKVSFGPALAVGTESLAEYFILDLPTPFENLAEATDRLSDNLPPGIDVTGVEIHNGKIPQEIITSYQVTFPKALGLEEQEKLQAFADAEVFEWSRLRKGKRKTINARPLIESIKMTGDNTIALDLINCASVPGIKPIEALALIFALNAEESLRLKLLKTGWHPIKSQNRY